MPSIVGTQRVEDGRRLVQGAIAFVLAALPGIAQTQVWIDGFGTEGQDAALALTTDGDGGVFVVGLVAGWAAIYGSGGGMGPGVGRGDVLLARYDASGLRLWTTRYGTPAEYDEANAVVPDGIGGVFVVGSSYGGPSGAGSGLPPRWLTRCDANGVQQWFMPLQQAQNPAAGARNESGGLLVCGSTGGSPDSWIASYDPTGNPLWSTTFPILINSWDVANAVVSDGSGGAFLCGISSKSFAPYDGWLAHVDGSGSLLWSTQFITSFDDYAYAVAGDGSGGVYVGGSTKGTIGGSAHGSSDMWLARYDAAGNQMWIRQYGTTKTEGIRGLTPSEGGGVLAAVRVGAKAILGRFDSDGNLIYLAPVGVQVGEYFTDAIESDGRGNTYLAGGTAGDPFSQEWSDLWLARYDGSCNPGTTYCVASSTSIPDCQSSISATGSPTLSNPTAWTVSSGPVPGANLGLLLFGSSGKDNTPYGTLGGKLCVASPTFRTAPTTSGGDSGQCNGSYAFTLSDLIAASPIVTSGATLHAQIWARDPANPDAFLLSDGLQVVVCP